MSIALHILAIVVLMVFCWKTFDFFKMSLVRAATMSGFQYYMEKIGFAIVIPVVVVAFASDFLGKINDLENRGKSKDVSVSQEVKQNKNTQQTSQVVQQPVEPTYTKDQVMEMENKVDYHGDDQTIRSRLGLPPKPASQY